MTNNTGSINKYTMDIAGSSTVCYGCCIFFIMMLGALLMHSVALCLYYLYPSYEGYVFWSVCKSSVKPVKVSGA